MAPKEKSGLAGVGKARPPLEGVAVVVAVLAMAVVAPNEKEGFGRLAVAAVLVAVVVVVAGRPAPRLKPGSSPALAPSVVEEVAEAAPKLKAGALAGEAVLVAGVGSVSVEETVTVVAETVTVDEAVTVSLTPPNSAGSLKVTELSFFLGESPAGRASVLSTAGTEGFAPRGKEKPPPAGEALEESGASCFSPMMKGKPPGFRAAADAAAKTAFSGKPGFVTAAAARAAFSAAMVAAAWSGKMLSILLSLFFCSSLSAMISLSPSTWGLASLLTGVPSTSAGLGGKMPVTLLLSSTTGLAAAATSVTASGHRIVLTLLFLLLLFLRCFRFWSDVLSGLRKTLLLLGADAWTSSSSSLVSGVTSSSLCLLRMPLLEDMLASSSAATALLLSGPTTVTGPRGREGERCCWPGVCDWACAVTTD